MRLSEEVKDTAVTGGTALIRAQFLSLGNKQKRTCPLLPLNPGTLEAFLYVDEVGGENEFSCLPKSHLLNEIFAKAVIS